MASADMCEHDWPGSGCPECRAALSPAATPVSEAGGDDWMQRQKDRKQREVEIMQEYRWGNLTPLGVANHLKRAGFNIDYAIKASNALAKPASSPAGGDVARVIYEGMGYNFNSRTINAMGQPYGAWAKAVDCAQRVAALSQSTSAGRVGE